MTQNPPVALSPLSRLEAQIEAIFVGKHDVVRRSLVTFLAGGHLLIEDVPGVGKTTLALTLAKSLGFSFQRIQFTSDLLPSDILGISTFNAQAQVFDFRPGPLFHQLILADELNRATPRTQSALLEAMNERQVTLDNHTHVLPKPFFVIATQNPTEHHGTYPLPESQLDRFTMRLTIGYPDTENEKRILQSGIDSDMLQQIQSCLSAEEIQGYLQQVSMIQVSPLIDTYILAIIQSTRTAPHIQVGASPRAALALRKTAQAYALMENRTYITPDDIKILAAPVLSHRLLFDNDQISDVRTQAERLIQTLLQQVPVPI